MRFANVALERRHPDGIERDSANNQFNNLSLNK